MENKWGQGNQKLEFAQIVLMHLKKILDLSTRELRNTSTEIVGPNFSRIDLEEDTRVSYVQSIENLAFVLIPYFDPPMRKVYDKCMKVIQSHNFQLNETFADEIKTICDALNDKNIPEDYFIKKRIEYAKILFIELNALLMRQNYLKASIYGESVESDDEIIEEGEDQ